MVIILSYLLLFVSGSFDVESFAEIDHCQTITGDLRISSWPFLESGLLDFDAHLPGLQEIQGRLYVVDGFESIDLDPASVHIQDGTYCNILQKQFENVNMK